MTKNAIAIGSLSTINLNVEAKAENVGRYITTNKKLNKKVATIEVWCAIMPLFFRTRSSEKKKTSINKLITKGIIRDGRPMVAGSFVFESCKTQFNPRINFPIPVELSQINGRKL